MQIIEVVVTFVLTTVFSILLNIVTEILAPYLVRWKRYTLVAFFVCSILLMILPFIFSSNYDNDPPIVTTPTPARPTVTPARPTVTPARPTATPARPTATILIQETFDNAISPNWEVIGTEYTLLGGYLIKENKERIILSTKDFTWKDYRVRIHEFKGDPRKSIIFIGVRSSGSDGMVFAISPGIMDFMNTPTGTFRASWWRYFNNESVVVPKSDLIYKASLVKPNNEFDEIVIEVKGDTYRASAGDYSFQFQDGSFDSGVIEIHLEGPSTIDGITVETIP